MKKIGGEEEDEVVVVELSQRIIFTLLKGKANLGLSTERE